ncbi:hypothetical protein GCM10010372_30880 [Streptomyces tauricus]|uniref:hypothetical protein n=1 Tax=Streptomyces tauricus TaxID=68274 RepID=UPI00167A7689|nr:hypothetical protein [Streptomyces tauricus]GHA28841.1 hypothetical protein GCM10010372_30880 [Streptomyces tauricus]
MTLPIAFIDCETTHLSAEIGEAWEVGVILREQDGEQTTDTAYLWQFSVDLEAADPEALRVGRFEERRLLPVGTTQAAFTGSVPPVLMSRAEAVTAIAQVLCGAVLVGSNPGFDERFLRKLLGPGSAQWHYRPYDIVLLAAAKIGAQAAGPLPWSSRILSRAVGVEPPADDVAHTALGDARWARDVYDAVMTREKFPLSWEGRAQHALGLYTSTAVELEDARRSNAELAHDAERYKEDHLSACRTIAEMHEAATGRAGLGPIRGVVEDVADVRAAAERAREIARRLAAHAIGFQDVLDDSDRGPWARTVGADIIALCNAFDIPSRPVMTSDITAYRFEDAEGDYLHIGIPQEPAGGEPAVSFCTSSEPVHVPVDEIEGLIAAVQRLATSTTAGTPQQPAIVSDHHYGRAWVGHEIEDACPCTKAPCGLVSQSVPECAQHRADKSTRQSHPADACPGPDALDDQDEEEEVEETGDADGDVFELISEIAGRLTDATDEGEYQAVGLIGDLANGRKTIAEAREELAEITFRHV